MLCQASYLFLFNDFNKLDNYKNRPKGRRFQPHRRHCVVSLSKNINPSFVLVQPKKTRPFITERLLMGCKESNHFFLLKPFTPHKRPWMPLECKIFENIMKNETFAPDNIFKTIET